MRAFMVDPVHDFGVGEGFEICHPSRASRWFVQELHLADDGGVGGSDHAEGQPDEGFTTEVAAIAWASERGEVRPHIVPDNEITEGALSPAA